MNYHYYCKKCRVYFGTEHPDPELREPHPVCPSCSTILVLGIKSLQEAKQELFLSKNEVSEVLI